MMKLAVVIPCLNEELTLGAVLEAVPQEISGIDEVLSLVVDDGCSDRSADVAVEHGARVVSHGTTRGVGCAFRTGLESALAWGADIVVNIDGDGQMDPEDIPALISPILEGRADFVTASRFAEGQPCPEIPALKRWGNRRIARLISRLTGQTFHDVSCGFRAYSRETALNLNLLGKFTYTHETFLDLAYKGLRILEVPVPIRGTRQFGKSRVAGSLLRYALQTSKIILKTYRDYRPFRFFGSVAAGLLSVSFFLLSFFLAHYWRTGAFSGHLWAGFTGGALGAAGLLFLVVAIVTDMLDRVRLNQERILYYLKKGALDGRPVRSTGVAARGGMPRLVGSPDRVAPAAEPGCRQRQGP
ncbi:MAG: glycosyltransferase family 2 protein [Deferrisomatales bacterium]|nr:glycosyltransferase family 2 protein [Deferrisomatales bacterium]